MRSPGEDGEDADVAMGVQWDFNGISMGFQWDVSGTGDVMGTESWMAMDGRNQRNMLGDLEVKLCAGAVDGRLDGKISSSFIIH